MTFILRAAAALGGHTVRLRARPAGDALVADGAPAVPVSPLR